ncbi:MAG: hypothetical protein KGY66_01935 [Candidatus Thermoplasmatota archaeon]|nr:hypothetical protein [Candidatus Thermoplasmatota archaeon]MBS3789657.1 hypothetical protein [Candidatus Thermoplasmatota archaeon]
MDVSLIIELVFLFIALLIVNFDVNRKRLDRKVFYVWVVGTAIGYYFYSVIGIVVVLILYFIWTRALLRRHNLG